MDTKKMSVMLITLVLGVILITGVMVPVLEDTLNGTGGSGGVTNDGPRMGNLPDVIEKYNVHSEYNNGYADTGTINMVFMMGENGLMMAIMEATETDYIFTSQFPITESSVLIAGTDCIIAYDHTNGTLDYAIPSATQPVNRIPVSELQVMAVYYDLVGSDDTLLCVFNTGTEQTATPLSDSNYLYDPTGDYVSLYGTEGSVRYDSELVYGYLNGGASTPVGYLDMNGDVFTLPESGVTIGEITDSHTTEGGFNLIDLDSDNAITIQITDSLNTAEDATCNIYIAPRTLGSGGEGTGVGGTLSTVISIIPLIMAAGLVLTAVAIWRR